MKIEFKNGSIIESIDCDKAIRSNYHCEHVKELIDYIYKDVFGDYDKPETSDYDKYFNFLNSLERND